MLQAIHDKAKGWIAYAIVGFISIPFALWGINSYFEGGGNRSAAIVNGEDIPAREVQNRLLQVRQQFGRMAASLGDDQLKQMALEGIINQTLLRQKAEEAGYRAGNTEVATNIAQSFQTDGQFDPEQYQRFLQTRRLNQGEFENRVRADLTLQQFRQAILATAFIPEEQADYYQSLRQQKRDIEHFVLKATDFETQANITDEQIAQYYEQNKAQFMTEQKVKLAYLDVNQHELAAAVEVTDEALQQFYDEHADRYMTPELREANQILVEIGDDEAKAQEKANALYEELNSGKSTFTAIRERIAEEQKAGKNTDIVVTVAAEVARGDWPESDATLFGLEENQLSKPVKTAAGFEILQVSKITEAVQKSLDAAKSQIEEDYRTTQAAELYLDKKDKVQTIAYEQNGDLTPAAQASGLEIKTTDWITRHSGEQIAANPKVRDAAFSEDVLGGKNSDSLALSDTQEVVIRVTEQQAAKQKTLDEVKDEIVATLKTQEARKLAAQKGDEVLKALQTANNWSALAESGAGNAEAVEKSGLVERVGSKLPPLVVSEAFAMTRPQGDQVASWGSTVLPNGDVVLIAVKAVEDGATEADEAARQQFNNSVSNRELDASLKSLRERADIELMPENI
ncbi:MAG: hypothetical protein CSA79_01210 [Thiothrix nivea]|nr:MAG: hypothetical protein CSA79_01210 [Thiothrix nivea]